VVVDGTGRLCSTACARTSAAFSVVGVWCEASGVGGGCAQDMQAHKACLLHCVGPLTLELIHRLVEALLHPAQHGVCGRVGAVCVQSSTRVVLVE
jgi:hypothetical protein